jgi:hypothetical protein
MAEAEVVAFFRAIDALEDRAMFLLMLRCGLRVSEVSSLLWTAIDMTQGTLRVNNRRLLLYSRVVGFADVIQPHCCHPFLLEALLFQRPYKGVVLLGQCLEHKTPESNKSDPRIVLCIDTLTGVGSAWR